ncbi:MAG: diguanylate cyclase [Tissierellales bacterium]|nr:diguanylate cyclase [Tissierellales bacterium]
MNKLTRKFYIYALIMALFVTILSIFVYNYLTNIIENQIQSRAIFETESKIKLIESNFKVHEQVVVDIESFIKIEPTKEEILKYLEIVMKEREQFTAVYIGTVDGELLAGEDWEIPADYIVKERPWYVKAVEENQLVYTEVYPDAYLNTWTITIAKPFYDSSGELKGVIASDIDLNKISQILNPINGEKEGITFLVDSKGMIIGHEYYNVDVTDESIEKMTIYNILPEFNPNNNFYIERTIFEERDGFLSYYYIKSLNMFLVNFVPVADTLKVGQQLIYTFVIFVISLIFVILFFFVFERRNIIYPVEKLVDDILKIPMGINTDYKISEKDDLLFEVKKTINELLINKNELLKQMEIAQEETNKIALTTEAMLAINRAANTNKDISEIYELILEQSLRAIKHAKLGSVMVKEDNMLRVVAHRGYRTSEIKEFSLPIEETFIYRATDGKLDSVAIIKDVSDYEIFVPLDTTEGEFYIKSSIIAPLYVKNVFYGCINLDAVYENAFDENDLKLMEFIQTNTEIAINNYIINHANFYLATHDALTGVYNRSYFSQLFESFKERALRYNEIFHLVMFDLNNLKYINDNFGHIAGDEAIKTFAKRLSVIIRKSDVFARYAGDEFVAIFLNTDYDNLKERLNELLRNMEQNPIIVDKGSVIVSFSYGISTFKEDSVEFEGLIKIADRRMYEMKNANRKKKE